MIVGAVKESFPGERRVALNPDAAGALAKKGFEVLIESGAGADAGFLDPAYRNKEARVVEQRSEVFSSAEVILQVRSLGANPEAGRADLELMPPEQVVIGFMEPLSAPEQCQHLAARGVTGFALELMPRITRAQSMDALSSMATVAGYKAVLLAAEALPRMFPMFMTAAGTVTPARVLVIGAGVAGLQAVATARRLGAVVSAYDLRPAVKEQVESLGARFVQLELETEASEDKGGYAKEMGEDFYRRQRELMARVLAENDVVICTAAVPGKKAPVLVTEAMVRGMTPGSVIMDLAAERGGNCELTQPDHTVIEHGVTILGPLNLPSTVPYHASQLYARNISTFLRHLVKDGRLTLDMEDEITVGTLVTRAQQVVHPMVRRLLELPALELGRASQSEERNKA